MHTKSNTNLSCIIAHRPIILNRCFSILQIDKTLLKINGSFIIILADSSYIVTQYKYFGYRQNWCLILVMVLYRIIWGLKKDFRTICLFFFSCVFCRSQKSNQIVNALNSIDKRLVKLIENNDHDKKKRNQQNEFGHGHNNEWNMLLEEPPLSLYVYRLWQWS